MVSIGPIAAAATGIGQSRGPSGVAQQPAVEQARFYGPAQAGKADAPQPGKGLSGGPLLPPASAAGPPSLNTPRGSLLDISV